MHKAPGPSAALEEEGEKSEEEINMPDFGYLVVSLQVRLMSWPISEAGDLTN